MADRGKSYDRLAELYGAAAHIYSGGKIRALKASQIGESNRGRKYSTPASATARTRCWRPTAKSR